MRIKSINIPEDQCQDGIKGIKMDRLGKVVILAGKNGSGKTRVLRNIEYTVKDYNNNANNALINAISIPNWINNQYSGNLDESYIAKAIIENYLKFDTVEQVMNFITELARPKFNMPNFYPRDKNLMQMISEIINIQSKLNISVDNFETIKLSSLFNISTTISDASDLKISMLINPVNTSSWQFSPAVNFAIIIKSLQISYNNNLLKKYSQKPYDSEIMEHHDNLIEIIDKYFGFKLSLDDRYRTMTQHSLEFNDSLLSNGQKILLQILVSAYFHNRGELPEILLFDEPENHLHPSALIEFFKLIEEKEIFSQIFIATHSVPLLAYFGVENIWYVEDGTVTYAGKTPQRVLEGLLGDENQINRLRALCDSPAHFAMLDFACECLTPPGVVMTDSNDPQNTQISEVLAKIEAENISILDYGCGKARLLANISEAMGREAFVKRYSYVGFDKYAEDKEIAESVITGVYGNSDNRYFNDVRKLKTEVGKEMVDVVILCNVLHEIPPQEWGNLFGSNGLISKMLKPEGYLLVVEDMCLTHGEVAHQYGFLVLGTNELMELFNITGKRPDDFIVDSQKDDRLLAHLIPRKYIIQYTKDTRTEAIEELSCTAKRKLTEIKDKNKELDKLPKVERNKLGLKLGHEYAFWVHQYTNADLALAEL